MSAVIKLKFSNQNNSKCFIFENVMEIATFMRVSRLKGVLARDVYVFSKTLEAKVIFEICICLPGALP